MTMKKRFSLWLRAAAEFLAGMRHPQYSDRRYISVVGCCISFKKDDK
jgi:hypothetical protein